MATEPVAASFSLPPEVLKLTRQLEQDKLDSLSRRHEILRKDNEMLKARLEKGEKDTHEFVAYFQRELEAKDDKIARLNEELAQQQAEAHNDKASMKSSYEERLRALEEKSGGTEIQLRQRLKTLEDDLAKIETFREKKTSMEDELQASRRVFLRRSRVGAPAALRRRVVGRHPDSRPLSLRWRRVIRTTVVTRGETRSARGRRTPWCCRRRVALPLSRSLASSSSSSSSSRAASRPMWRRALPRAGSLFGCLVASSPSYRVRSAAAGRRVVESVRSKRSKTRTGAEGRDQAARAEPPRADHGERAQVPLREGEDAEGHGEAHERDPAAGTHTHARTHTRAHTHAHTRARAHARTPTLTHAHTHTHTHTHTHKTRARTLNLITRRQFCVRRRHRILSIFSVEWALHPPPSERASVVVAVAVVVVAARHRRRFWVANATRRTHRRPHPPPRARARAAGSLAAVRSAWRRRVCGCDERRGSLSRDRRIVGSSLFARGSSDAPLLVLRH